MKCVLTIAVAILLAASSVFAVRITLFIDTPTYADRAKDIVIARCKSSARISDRPSRNGFDAWDVEVLRVLKGDAQNGPLRVASIYPLEPSKTYMLYSLGGSANGSKFLTVPQLSVIELPEDFDLKQLDDKDLVTQIKGVMAARLDQVNRELARLQEEQKLLKTAVGKQLQP